MFKLHITETIIVIDFFLLFCVYIIIVCIIYYYFVCIIIIILCSISTSLPCTVFECDQHDIVLIKIKTSDSYLTEKNIYHPLPKPIVKEYIIEILSFVYLHHS